MGVPLIAVAIICGFAFAAGAWAHWLTTSEPTPARSCRPANSALMGRHRMWIPTWPAPMPEEGLGKRG